MEADHSRGEGPIDYYFPVSSVLVGMVSKITIFEPHFHDAQFGPTMLEGDGTETDPESTDDDSVTASSGSSRLAPLFVLLGLVVVGGLLARRRSQEDEVDADAMAEIEVEA